MAFEPQRFIHAANIRLDVPVSVQTTETLTDELRFAFEDATLHAFEEVIEACVRHDVDYLLLSGNVFVEADRSLRARLALLRGFRRLAEHDIQVFVLPGDSDPPEAWRAIPDMPDNVVVCYSSNPEPEELYIQKHLATTVSTSMWLGEADAFGIRVLAKDSDGIQPFRIGIVSKAKYEESRRMASMTASASDETITASLQHIASGEQLNGPQTSVDPDDEDSTRVWRSIDTDDGQRPRKAPDSGRRAIKRSLETLEAGPADAHPSLDPGFIHYVDEMLQEGQLNFLALTGELARTTLWREDGVVHCPGTTQPRSQMEASGGACSLVDVSETGEIRISSVDSSCVDWQQIEVHVAPHTNLSSMLQQMKTLLLGLKPAAADRIWSVQWILRGALPVLQELARNDLDVAAAVELDELKHSGRTIRLLHDIRPLPNTWPAGDPPTTLADQYQQFTGRSRVTDESLQSLLDSSKELTTGWKQRLTSLLPSIDPEQILAKLRTDGATWFEPDFGLATEVEEDSSSADAYDESGADDDDVTDDGDAEQEVAESVLRSRELDDAPDDEEADDESMDDEDSDDEDSDD